MWRQTVSLAGDVIARKRSVPETTKEEEHMSVKDLIEKWEEALAVALTQPDDQEMQDRDLTYVADRRIARVRTAVRGASSLPLWSSASSSCQVACDSRAHGMKIAQRK